MFEDIAEKIGKTVEELMIEFDGFKVELNEEFENKLEGEILEKRAVSLFRQKYRYKILSSTLSPAISVNVLVIGVTGLNDRLSWKRDNIIKNYKLAPNKYVYDGKVNEYSIVEVTDEYSNVERVITKISVDGDTKERTEIVVESLPEGAVQIKEDFFVAPKDSEQMKWGRVNFNYGKELPAHEYNRDVFGVAEIEDDIRYFRMTLRGAKAQGKLPVPGKTYQVKVLDITKDKAEEYLFKDSPSQTQWNEIDWNPYLSDSFVEQVLEEPFMLDHIRTLGELREIAEKEDKAKEDNKERVTCGERPDYTNIKYNSCLFVEGDVMDITIEPASTGLSSRLMLSDDSLKWEFNDEAVGAIAGWLSDAVNVDFGVDSRVILCCYPKLAKAKDNVKIRAMQLDVYGAIAIDGYKTIFNPTRVGEI